MIRILLLFIFSLSLANAVSAHHAIDFECEKITNQVGDLQTFYANPEPRYADLRGRPIHELAMHYKKWKSPLVRDLMQIEMRPRFYKIAKYRLKNNELAEEASVKLLGSIDEMVKNFDTAKGEDFWAFIQIVIKRRLIDFSRAHGRLNREETERWEIYQKGLASFRNRKGFEPNDEELTEELAKNKVAKPTIAKILVDLKKEWTFSATDLNSRSDNSDVPIDPLDGVKPSSGDKLSLQDQATELLKLLDPETRHLIDEFYLKGAKLKVIGQALEKPVGESTISERITNGIKLLRTMMGNQPNSPDSFGLEGGVHK